MTRKDGLKRVDELVQKLVEDHRKRYKAGKSEKREQWSTPLNVVRVLLAWFGVTDSGAMLEAPAGEIGPTGDCQSWVLITEAVNLVHELGPDAGGLRGYLYDKLSVAADEYNLGHDEGETSRLGWSVAA